MLLASCCAPLAAPLCHDSAGGGGRQIALLDWFRKRTRSTPSGDDEVKLRAKTRKLFANYNILASLKGQLQLWAS
jgi:hypothetical protein